MSNSINLREEVGYFFTAMTFLTRLPVARWSINTENSLLKSSVYFPFVGACIGLICAATYFITVTIWSENIAIILAIAAGIVATGAFHEDGFADVLDSMGAFDKDKKLQIMKDSRLGTYGVSGFVVLLMVKFFTLQYTIDNGLNILIVFVTAHSLSRWICLPLIYFNDYVSPSSRSGKDLIAYATDERRLLTSTLFTLLLIALLNLSSLIYLVISISLVLLMTQFYFRRSFGGITGDCLGAANQITEATVFLIFALHVN